MEIKYPDRSLVFGSYTYMFCLPLENKDNCLRINLILNHVHINKSSCCFRTQTHKPYVGKRISIAFESLCSYELL